MPTTSTPTTTTSADKQDAINQSLERLALLQSLSSSSSSTSTGAVAAAAAAAASAFNLKTLLIKKEKQTTNTNSDNQFKPISNAKTDNTNILNACNNNNELEDEDDEEEDLDTTQQQLKLQMPLATPHSSSSSCTSPVNTLTSQAHLNAYDPINTADIAQKVRDLLSVHNIGQRVFAKYILGLSQGTVSELLSKPKHWDKLTEKGRESYRKMYTWSCSEQSINKLKQISPRKGNKDSYFYHNQHPAQQATNVSANLTCKEDSAATEERIAQILSEAQKQMKAANGMKVAGMRATQNDVCSSPSPSGSSSARSASSSAASPLMSPSMFQSSSSSTPKNLSGMSIKASQFKPMLHNHHQMTSNNKTSLAKQNENQSDNESDEEMMLNDELMMNEEDMVDDEMNQDETRKLTKTNLDETATAYPLDLTVKTQSASSNKFNQQQQVSLNKKIKLESNDFYSNLMMKPNNSTSDSENMLMNRKISSSSTVSTASSLMHSKSHSMNPMLSSPLKNIQSIADSYLISQQLQQQQQQQEKLLMQQQSPNSSFQRPASTPSPSLSIASQNMSTPLMAASQNASKPLKCVLPPVSQEQFDRYSSINTEELVKKVKDLLGKFSISQRLFGECILGLSQGSVSDLLARPKPWNMLTQKGREPFIRMQMFIDDPDAIKKLMANQYKTPTQTTNDKLVRPNGKIHLISYSI